METKTVFDQADIEYLASHLNESQLHNEIHLAQIAWVVAEQFRGTEYEDESDRFPYRDYRTVCEKALELVKQQRPKPQPAAGKVDIGKLKEAHDIVTVIERYTKLKKVGNRFVGRCPIHNDKNPSLIVYLAQQSWHCFGCNTGGDVISFVMAIEKVDFRQATAILGSV